MAAPPSLLAEMQEDISSLSALCGYMVRAHFAFREHHDELCERHEALCECLQKAGVLAPEELLANLQAQRSARTFSKLLDESSVVRTVAQAAGISAVRCACAASTACLESVADALIDGIAEGIYLGTVDPSALFVSKPLFQHLVDWLQGSLPRPPAEPDPWGAPELASEDGEAPGDGDDVGDVTFVGILHDAEPAQLVARAAGAAATTRLSTASRASRWCTPAPASSAQDREALPKPSCQIRASPRSPSIAKGVGSGTASLMCFGAGNGCAALLQDMWQLFVLANTLVTFMCAGSVHRFRATSRASFACMRGAGALPGQHLPWHTACRARATSRQQEAKPKRCELLLREIWQSLVLADTITAAMGSEAVCRFRAIARAGRECMQGRGLRGDESLPSAQASAPSASPRIGGAGAAAPQSLGPVAGSCSLLETLREGPAILKTVGLHMGPAAARSGALASRLGAELLQGLASRPVGGTATADLQSEEQPPLEPASGLQAPQPPSPSPQLQLQLPPASQLPSPQLQLQVRSECPTFRSGSQDARLDEEALSDLGELTVGQLVVVRGLRTRTRFNGLPGRLVCHIADTDRWNVLLSSGEAIRVHRRNVDVLTEASKRRSGKAAAVRALPSWPPPPASITDPLPSASDDLSQSQPLALMDQGGRAASPLALPALKWAYVAEHFADSDVICNLAIANRALFQAVAKPTQFYVCGGCDGRCALSSVEGFSTTTGEWFTLPPMLQQHDAAACGVLGRYLYICGGTSSEGASSQVERFDPAIGAWQVMPPMNKRRSFAAIVALKGLIYVFGGGISSQSPLTAAECFSPFKRTWQMLPAMFVARSCPVAVAIGRRIYVCGGSDLRPLASLECYDTVTEKWFMLGSMQRPRFFSAHALIGQYLYICGGCGGALPGQRDSQESLSSVERFDAGAGIWGELPPMLEARCGAVAAVTSGSRIHVCGGCRFACGDSLQSTECYDPSVGVWVATPPMRHRRTFAAGVSAMGHIYVCGGNSGGSVARTVERMDVKTKEWEEVASMTSQRIGATGVAPTLKWEMLDTS